MALVLLPSTSVRDLCHPLYHHPNLRHPCFLITQIPQCPGCPIKISSLSSFTLVSKQARQNHSVPSSATSQLQSPFSLRQVVNHLCRSRRIKEAHLLLQEELKKSRYDLAEVAEATGALLQACGEHKKVDIGRKVHQTVSAHFRNDLVLGTRLITMYGMCGYPVDSRLIFDLLEGKNLVVWNAMISGYIRNGLYDEAVSMFCELISATDLKPDHFTLPCVIKACGGIREIGTGGAVHGLAIKSKLVYEVSVGNALISMYERCGYEEESLKVFENMPQRNSVSWNSVIHGYSENGSYEESLALFVEMLTEEGLTPDVATIVILLPACAAEGDVDMGMLLHGLAVKLGFAGEQNVSNTLMDMYAKCGFSSEAKTMFEKNKNKNVVSCNAMIDNHSRNENVGAAFDLLRRMQVVGGENLVDEVTILNILPCCTEKSKLISLKELHGYSFRHGFNYHELLCNAFVAAYSKCGLPSYADNVFNLVQTEKKTVNLWNALISGYAQNGDPEMALDLFRQMIASSLDSDCYSLGSLLSACAQLKLLHTGKEVHSFMLRNELKMNSVIGVSLLSFYFSCEKPHSALAIFEGMKERNVVHWNTMISGYLQNDFSEEAITLFHRMVSAEIRPYEIAITSLLRACSKLSSLRLGKEAHCFALKANLTRDSILSSAVIDMYAKCGCLEHSFKVFKIIDKKELAPFNAMIVGLAVHGHAKSALELFQELVGSELKPDHFTFTGLLMACSHSGLVKEGLEHLKQMEVMHGIRPKLEHYSCVVDMLGRNGLLKEVLELVGTMPFEPDAKIWSSLVSSCILNGELSMGRRITKKLSELEPDEAKNYVLLSNVMAHLEKWEDVGSIRRRMKEMGFKKDAGCSWIEVSGEIHYFISGNDFAS